MKQLNNILKISIVLLLLNPGIACKKFLDKKPNSRLTTINRIEDLQALLDRHDNLNVGTVPNYGEISADDYFFPQSTEVLSEKGKLAYTWQIFDEADGSSNVSNDWAHCYYPINLANICLEKIEGLSKTAENSAQWNNVKGSALFLRAFNYLNLCWTFCKAYDEATSSIDLGLPLRLTTNYNEPTVRATVEESYQQVIKDAKASLLFLPAISIHPLRPSKAASYGLLARAYLSMRIYDSAKIYSDSCLQIRSELIDYNGDGDIVSSISGINPPFRRYNKETIFYADMNSSFLINLLVSGNVDTVLYTMYAPDDLRKIAFFTPGINFYQKFKGDYSQITAFFGGIATDEMLLIRAESYARKDMVVEAMADLNALMIRRWSNTVAYPVITANDPADALNKVLLERRKELLFRGLRWSDIKRLNKEGTNITLNRIVEEEPYELLPNSDKYALPIPDDIIRLTGIDQNTGWQ